MPIYTTSGVDKDKAFEALVTVFKENKMPISADKISEFKSRVQFTDKGKWVYTLDKKDQQYKPNFEASVDTVKVLDLLPQDSPTLTRGQALQSAPQTTTNIQTGSTEPFNKFLFDTVEKFGFPGNNEKKIRAVVENKNNFKDASRKQILCVQYYKPLFPSNILFYKKSGKDYNPEIKVDYGSLNPRIIIPPDDEENTLEFRDFDDKVKYESALTDDEKSKLIDEKKQKEAERKAAQDAQTARNAQNVAQEATMQFAGKMKDELQMISVNEYKDCKGVDWENCTNIVTEKLKVGLKWVTDEKGKKVVEVSFKDPKSYTSLTTQLEVDPMIEINERLGKYQSSGCQILRGKNKEKDKTIIRIPIRGETMCQMPLQGGKKKSNRRKKKNHRRSRKKTQRSLRS
jgi:hypothetical protein